MNGYSVHPPSIRAPRNTRKIPHSAFVDPPHNVSRQKMFRKPEKIFRIVSNRGNDGGIFVCGSPVKCNLCTPILVGTPRPIDPRRTVRAYRCTGVIPNNNRNNNPLRHRPPDEKRRRRHDIQLRLSVPRG